MTIAHLTNMDDIRPESICETASLMKQANKYIQHPTHSRWIWGVRLRKHNVGAPSWRSMTTGMRGKRTARATQASPLLACGGSEGIPEGRADAGANECPKAICEHTQLSKLTPEYTNPICEHSKLSKLPPEWLNTVNYP